MATGTGDGALMISGGQVVTPAGVLLADLLVSGGRVRALAEHDADRRAAGRLDASGCFVLPGGVDPHCHIMADVTAATTAAALGGTTTALSFTNPDPGEGAVECLLRRRESLSSDPPAVDVGLHAMLYQPDRCSPAELAAMRDAGVSGIKLFLAYPELGIMWSTRGLFELMAVAARAGQVVQVHCEEGEVIEGLVAAAIAAGSTGPQVFAQTRPPPTEAAAVARVLAVAAITGAACYLPHLSCSEALDQVRLARGHGTSAVCAEVCLHHLLLDDRCYERDDAERFLVCPPLRPARHAEALWAAVADGTLDTVGSDHAQARSRTVGELAPDGRGYRYGIAGVGARLPLLLSRGLARGLPIERLATVCATNPARAFGHYPRKGVIAPGSDADLLVWDPRSETAITAATFDDGTGNSVYAGERLCGRVRDVLLRGRVVVRDGEYVGSGADGAYLPRSASPARSSVSVDRVGPAVRGQRA